MKTRPPRHGTLAVTLLLAALLVAPASAGAAPGDVDPGFVPPTISNTLSGVGTVNATVVQPDGKIVIGGKFTDLDGTARISLARLNPNGSHDTSFVSPFVAGSTDTIVNALALQPDGKILVGGIVVTPDGNSTQWRNLVRVNSNGSLDTTFNPNPLNVFGIVNKVVVREDGAILCAGNFAGVTVLNPIDGSPLNTSIPAYGGFFNPVRGFVPDGTGMLIAGNASLMGPAILTRFDASNLQDPSFHVPTVQDNSIVSVERQVDGSLFIAGRFSTVDGATRKLAARLMSTGFLDQAFDLGDALGEIGTVKTQPDGKVIVGGSFRPSGEANNYGFARLNANGTFDPTFQVQPPNRNANGRVGSIQLLPDGKILIAGNFTTVNGTARTLIARLLVTDNAPPALSNVAAAPGAVNEGGTVTLSGQISDADAADSFVLRIDWGDGTTPQTVNLAAGATSFSVTHAYRDDSPTGTGSDPSTIALTLSDSGGASATFSTTVTVINVAPMLSAVVATPSTIVVGGTTTVGGSINDVGNLDPHSVMINWGDGSASATLNLAAGMTTFSASHQYATPGNFTVTISATDDDTGTAGANVVVTVSQALLLPAPPSSLAATVLSTTQVTLTWQDNSSNEAGFEIERCKGRNCKDFSVVAQTASNVTTHQDNGLSNKTAYRYRIRAVNGDGNSAYSNLAAARTPRK